MILEGYYSEPTQIDLGTVSAPSGVSGWDDESFFIYECLATKVACATSAEGSTGTYTPDTSIGRTLKMTWLDKNMQVVGSSVVTIGCTWTPLTQTGA